jgi:DNA-binding beta-propeller fold protein YncE
VRVPELAGRETAPQVFPPHAGFCPHRPHERTVAMRILVTSASGANGNGYGAILGFGPEGEFMGPFSGDPRIADPRGLSLDPSGALVYLNSGDDRILALDLHGCVVRDSGRIPGLDPGGAEFGPDGRYYVTVRRQRTIRALPAALDEDGEFLLPEGIVPFPRGFGFGHDGRLYVASGIAPSGKGDNTIVVFDRSGTVRTPRLVSDPELSPLDLKVAPNGNIVVASEWPFGAPDAVTSVREYDTATGQLVRVLVPEQSAGFRRPRGLRFGPGGYLYCVGEDHVVAFDFRTGSFAGPVVHLARLNGQALVLVP